MNSRRHFALRCAIGGVFVFGLVQSAQVSRDGMLSVRIVASATGISTPARVTLQDSSGSRPHVRGAVAVSDSAIPIPKQAIALLWGQQDRAEGYALQPDGSFYVDGSFDVRLPPGDYTITVSKGFEYVSRTDSVSVGAGASTLREYRMDRWTDM